MKNVKCARCVRCGKEYEAVPNLTNCSCGGILDIVYDYDYIKAHLTKETLKNRVNPTMWRYRELLPVEETTPDTPLRVGWSPLYEEPKLAEMLGLGRLWVKDDGYTIGVLNCDLVLNNVLGNTDITSNQFVPLACIENDPYLFVVSKDAPYQTFEEFVEYAKAHPGEITVADTGAGAAPHLGYLALVQDLGLDLKTVAYDSAADSVVAVVSGEVQAAITASGAAVGQMDGGNIVPLAVTSNERLSTYPDVPAMGELYTELADMQVNSWIMVAVKADVDPEIVSFLQSAFAPAAVSDAYKTTQEGFFFQPVEEMSNEDMLNFVADQHSYYESLLK